MSTLEKHIFRVTVVVGVLTLCLMTLQIVIDVFMRNWAGAGFPATAELVSRYYMVAVSFLPIAYTEVKRRHIEATVFTDMMPQFVKRSMLFVGFVLGLAVYALLTYGAWREALSQTSRGSYVEAGSVEFLTWPSYWILPVAFFMMALMMLVRAVSVLRGTFNEPGAEETIPGSVAEQEEAR